MARRAGFVISALGVFLLGVPHLFTWFPAHRDTDLWFGAGQAIRSGLSPYDVPGFFSPPPYAAAWAPMSAVGRPAAYAMWLVVLWAGLMLAAVFLAHRTGRKLWLVGFLPFAHMLYRQGQVDGLMIALVCSAALAIDDERDVLAGVLLAIAAFLKLYPALLIPMLLAMDRRRAFVRSVVACALLGVFAPALFVGFTALPELYAEHLRTVLSVPVMGHSLGAILPTYLVHGCGVLMVVLAAREALRGTDTLRAFGLVLAAVMFTSTVVHGHNYLVGALLLADVVERHAFWGTVLSLSFGLAFWQLAEALPEWIWTGAAVGLWWVSYGLPLFSSEDRARRRPRTVHP